MKKEKKVKSIVANTTSKYWKITKGRKATEISVVFYNGEHHTKGKWDDNGEIFELPSVFFNDVKPV